jgi:hypothetical protein
MTQRAESTIWDTPETTVPLPKIPVLTHSDLRLFDLRTM